MVPATPAARLARLRAGPAVDPPRHVGHHPARPSAALQRSLI
jgi:hypothetical protein